MPQVTRVPYIDHIVRVARAADDYVIQGSVLEPHQVLVIETVAASNAGTALKNLQFGSRVNGVDIWWGTITGKAKDTYEIWTGPITILSEYRLIFKVVDPSIGDVTTINVNGYFTHQSTVPPELP